MLASRPVFIVGAARSGTNLVRALLSAHPSIELRNEPELLLALFRVGIGPGDSVSRDRRTRLLLDLNTGLTREHVSALPAETIEEFLTSPADLGLKDVYELLLPRPAGDVVWGEKSLGNGYLMREIANLYPDALFLHVIRDPRATTRSWVALRYADDEPELELEQQSAAFVTYAAMRWTSWVDAIDDGAAALSDGAVLEVRFEELVKSPEIALRSVCAALDLELDERMLDPESRRRDPVLRSRESAHRRLAEPLDPERASAGAALPGWAAVAVERYSREGMVRHGYEPTAMELSREEEAALRSHLEFLEPIVRERVRREFVRSGPPDRGSPDGGRVESAEGGSKARPDPLAVLAATALRRRGAGADSKSEVEALREFAAATLDQLDDARAARARAQRRLAAAKAKVRSLREKS